MKVLVTGANGLLATHAIQQLLKDGYEVKGFLRDRRKIQITDSNLELAEGDIRDKTTVNFAIKDCDYVVHIAAFTSQKEPDFNKYHEVNVGGTEILLNAAIKNKLKKFIFISSANTIGYGSYFNPGKEELPIRYPFTHSHYARSKLEAEQKVLEAAKKINVVILNPSFMLGAYDAKPSSGRIILLANKPVVFYPPGGKNFVNATDVAKGISVSISRSLTHHIYLLTGENMSYKTFFEKTTRLLGVKPFFVKLPTWFLKSIGYVGDLLRFIGVSTAVSTTHMKILCVENFYTNQRAKKDLDIELQPVEKGIKSAIEWFRSHEMLK